MTPPPEKGSRAHFLAPSSKSPEHVQTSVWSPSLGASASSREWPVLGPEVSLCPPAEVKSERVAHGPRGCGVPCPGVSVVLVEYGCVRAAPSGSTPLLGWVMRVVALWVPVPHTLRGL